MESLRTPDVYIKEEATLPPSVAEISTAVPIFIGHTEKAVRGDDSLLNVPIRINSLPEYRLYFGGPDMRKYTVTVENNIPPYAIVVEADDNAGPQQHQLFYSLDHFFKNGGSDCYVLSIGSYGQDKTKENFSAALALVEKEDEPTLIVLSEACSLDEQAYYDLCSEALRQCGKLMDRFCLIDVLAIGPDGEAKSFKDKIGTNYLKYGAAYYPSLKTSIGYQYQDEGVTVAYSGNVFGLSATNSALTAVRLAVKITTPLATTASAAPTKPRTPAAPIFSVEAEALTITVEAGTPIATIVKQWESVDEKKGFNLDSVGDDLISQSYDAVLPKGKSKAAQVGGLKVTNMLQTDPRLVISVTTPTIAQTAPTVSAEAPTFSLDADALTIGIASGTSARAIMEKWGNVAEKKGYTLQLALTDALTDELLQAEYSKAPSAGSNRLDKIKVTHTALYNAIRQRLNMETVTLRPSPAVAGVYATVDRERGVWKAPANVSLSAVVGPAQKIDATQQEKLNIDTNSGKSINAIRSFTGRGTLIWGARTLAGNDNEWRYISVRRLFNMVEESAKKATFFAVFEPNDAATWLKVRGMIESYLYTLWQQGALAGPSPKAAYYVRVGLGTTMTTDDVNNGKMIIEIGMAAVRPAEFIVLTFSHKLQEA